MPAASPSALTTQPAPPAARSVAKAIGRLGFGEDAGVGHPDAGRGGDVVAERLAGFDARGVARRPEDREPGLAQRIGDAGGQRRLGPDDDQLDRVGSRHGDDRRAVERIHRHAADARLGRDPGTPRRDDDLVDARLRGELPGERVFAPATADHQDPGRHDQGHATIPGRLRIGRQARSIVWVRSGPTDTSTIGTPACDSMALR